MSWFDCDDPIPGDSRSVDAIKDIIVPRSVDLGEMTVRRALPSTRSQMIGPFIFFDHIGPAHFLSEEGVDVRPHPHINLATVTYLFDGEIIHKDSLGSDRAITPGSINWMFAGRGIVHSERSARYRPAGRRLSGLQSWVALPESHEERAPDFIHIDSGEVPEIKADGCQMRLLAGSAYGEESPLKTASETLFADIKLKSGASLPIDNNAEERAIYTLSGSLSIDGMEFSTGQLIVLRPGVSMSVHNSGNTVAHLMLFGGATMEGPRHIWWNFVSSRAERIEAAKEEWRRGRFETVPGDVEEFVPLPEGVGKPRKIVPSNSV